MRNLTLEDVPIKEVILELKQFHRAHLYDRGPLRIDFVKDHSEQLLARLTRDVWGMRGNSVTVRWPATWWQHFKQRWFPKWALARWPVEFTVKKWDAWALAPDLELADARGKLHRVVKTLLPNWEVT